MKITEAIDRLTSIRQALLSTPELPNVVMINLIDTSLALLQKVQQYVDIGTVEDCRIAMEKQKAKKPTPIDYTRYVGVVENAKALRGLYWCPNCHQTLKSGSFCKNCGQKLDWDRLEW